MIDNPTIYALSSGAGRAGIAVVRLSGGLSSHIVQNFTGSLTPPRRAVARQVRQPSHGLVLDQAVVLWLPGPNTVTGEDMAEFHLHGAPAVLSAFFNALSGIAGVRLAEPGEFTKRGFVNGRMDLVEVEGLSDLLLAQTESQRRLAMRQVMGEASAIYDGWRDRLLSSLALMEAAIDFSEEEDVASDAVAQSLALARVLCDELSQALAQSDRVGLLRTGVKVVIAGEPNVGKSSLLNALVARDVAIVSHLAGTTRDVIEVTIDLGGVAVVLTDTAGIRNVESDTIEAIGIARAEKEIAEADILVGVVSVGQPLSMDFGRPLDILVVNKCDNESMADTVNSIHVRNEKRDCAICAVSAKTGYGIANFLEVLSSLVMSHTEGAEDALIVRARHRMAIAESIRHLNDGLNSELHDIALVSEHIRRAARRLAQVTGHIDVEDMLGKIFSSFCIGK